MPCGFGVVQNSDAPLLFYTRNLTLKLTITPDMKCQIIVLCTREKLQSPYGSLLWEEASQVLQPHMHCERQGMM